MSPCSLFLFLTSLTPMVGFLRGFQLIVGREEKEGWTDWGHEDLLSLGPLPSPQTAPLQLILPFCVPCK